MSKKGTKTKNESEHFKKPMVSFLLVAFWVVGLTPFLFILYLRYIQTDSDSLPSVSMLENQEELLATTIFADDGMTELGKYWTINRTSVSYDEISPYVVSALI